MPLQDLIRSGLSQLPFSCPEALPAQLAGYIERLTRWNQSYNLTSVRDPAEMVVQHLLDSLSIAPYLSGVNIIDVGSGAGLPGLPLALLYPEKNFVLLDSNGKKTRFITQVVIEQGIGNIEVVHDRVENYHQQKFDHVLCRAFASLDDIAEKVSHLLLEQGNVLAMKGRAETMLNEQSTLCVRQILPLSVPLLDGERHLIELRPRT